MSKRKHLRALRAELTARGFTILEQWMGGSGHHRIRVARNDRTTTLTVRADGHAMEELVENTIKQAERATRCQPI